MAVDRRLCQGECGLHRSEKFFKSPKARICELCQKKKRRAGSRARRLGNVYEISQAEYEALYLAQEGKCAVCKEPRQYLLHVEHDHVIEKEHGVRASIRGLACKRCNGLLRDARDNAQLLRLCAEYLENPPAQAILAAFEEVQAAA